MDNNKVEASTENQNNSILSEVLKSDVSSGERIKSTVDAFSNETGSKTALVDILNTWKEERSENRKEKINIRKFLMRTIVFQLVFIAVVIVFNGFEILGFSLEQWTLSLIVTGVFAETITVFSIVVKNIFPEDDSKAMVELLKHVYSNEEK